MQRLRELQIVTLMPPAPAQAYTCRVIVIEGAQALLLTRESVQAAFVRDCMLTFDHEGQTVEP